MTRKRLLAYYPLVDLLAKQKLSNDQFKCIIECLNDDVIDFLCECCKNAISKEYVTSMSKKEKKLFLNVINPHSKTIKKLCTKRTNCNRNRKVIAQKGYGFIIPILASVLPLLSSILVK